MAQLVENPPAMRETWVRSLGWEDHLEKGKANHFSILAWRIPWTIVHDYLESMTERLSLMMINIYSRFLHIFSGLENSFFGAK